MRLSKMFLPLVLLALALKAAAAEPIPLWQKGDPWPYAKPNIRGLVVKASATLPSSTFVYTYSIAYPATNSPNYRLCFFTVDIRRHPEVHPFTYREYSATHQPVIDSGFHEVGLRPTLEDRVQPLQKFAPSDGPWDHAILVSTAISGVAGWIGVEDCWLTHGWMAPGQAIEGIGIAAREPPGIRDYAIYLKDVRDPDLFNRLAEFYRHSKYFSDEWTIANELSGRTLAPVAAPEPFSASTWTARLLAYAAETRKQGWLKSDRQLARFIALINGLAAPDTVALRKAVAAVDAYAAAELAAGRMTQEADALLRLNAEYLLRRAEQDPGILKETP